MRLLLSILSLLMLASCSGETQYLVPKPDDKFEKEKSDSLRASTKVDVLFVIDDSGSMGTHQRNLAANIDIFLQTFVTLKFIDYHVGVISTDLGDTYEGYLMGNPKIVTPQTPNLLLTLKQNLLLGTNGGSTEGSFSPIIRALTDPILSTYNAGFYRDDAILVTIFITDAEEQSRISATDFYNFLLNLKKNNRDKLLNFGAIVPTGENCGETYGRNEKYEDFFGLARGVYFSLCSSNFGVGLAKFSDSIFSRTSFVPLKRIPAKPVSQTIRVKYGTQIIPNNPVTGWAYDSERVGIYFGPELQLVDEANAELIIDYIPADKIEQ